MSNPFDVPTPPKKQTPNASRDDYEEMFPSARGGGEDDDDGPTGNIAARMYADEEGEEEEEEEDVSPWGGTKNDTRYT